MRALTRSALSAVAAVCLAATAAFAQVDTGSILGTVKDTSGAVLSGAKVTLVHEGEALSLSAVTRSDGTYIFTPIKIGEYSVTVEYVGFGKAVRRGIKLNIQQQAVVDFALAPGDLVEAVEVTADAPLLETQTGTVGQIVTGDTIKNLPLNGRDYTFLARLSTGVVPPHQGARAPLQFSANGIKPSQNNYMLDGIDNNNSNVDFLSGVAYVIKPPVDAIAEFKILTSSFNAEYGRAGGAVLNATLKSGSNEFHGSAWEFHRNDGLNANNFFANRAGVPKGEYRSNQFGFTAGGPVIRGKTFWFADYEGTLIKQARVWNETVPTARQRASGFTDFSDLITLQSGTIGPDILGRSYPRGTIFDPATTRSLVAGQIDPVTGQMVTSTGYVRDPFPGNIIPAGRIDPNALRLMMLYPDATLPGLNNNYVVNRTNTDNTHAFDLRVDHNFSENDRVFARYSFSDNDKLRPPPFEGDADGGGFAEGTETVRVHGLAVSHTHVFSSSTINEARFGFVRERTYRLQPNGDDTSDIPASYGITGIPQLPGNGGLPRIEPSGLRRLGHDGWVVSERFSNTLQFSDNLTKVYKSHTFKGGYTFQHIFFGSTQPPFARGEYFFNGNYTSMVNRREDYAGRAQFLLKPIAATVPGGVDFLGGMSQLNVSPFGSVDALKWYQGAYVQDSWRATSKLTVNFGLRWDYFSRELEREWEQANMDPENARYYIPARWRDKQLSPSFINNLARDGIELVYTDEYGSGLGKMPKFNLAPRFDFAYQFNPRLVARGGYGIFYGAFENRGGNPSLGYNYPFQFDLRYFPPNDVTPNRVADGSIAYLTAREGINLDPLVVNANGLGLRGVEFDYKMPRYHSYNANVQVELGQNHSAEVGYVGTLGRNLEINTGMNHIDRLLPPGTNPTPYIPFPSFARGGVFYSRTLGKSSYDSLQVKLQRRMHRGLSFLASYTLGNSRTNTGDFLGGENIGGLRAQGIAGWSLDNDIRKGGQYVKHAFVLSGTYALPGGGAILGGWQFNWLLMMYSGQAQTINCSRTTGSTTGCYALLVGDPYAGSHSVEQFYNPAAFANPAPVATIGQTDFSPLGGEGTQVTGPPWRQLDVGLAKQFTLSGRQLEFRAEAFNLTNTPAFNLPGSLNFEDARNFAQITGQRNNPRIVQLGLKVYW